MKKYSIFAPISVQKCTYFLQIAFLRCPYARRGFFFLKIYVFALSACPQGPFFSEKLRYCAVSMPAGDFFF